MAEYEIRSAKRRRCHQMALESKIVGNSRVAKAPLYALDSACEGLRPTEKDNMWAKVDR
jgi:hypothetical protein